MRGSRLVTTERLVCLTAPDSDKLVERINAVASEHELACETYEVGETVPDETLQKTDTLGVVVGGDGTFLRAISAFAPREIPVVGINAGTLAFLSRIQPSAIDDAFDEILSGRAGIVPHQLFRVTGPRLDVVGINETTVESPSRDTSTRRRCALEVFVDDEYVGEYDGGGLVVNTPTGSTAMALSAGGPIHDPSKNETLQITPLHVDDLSARSIVLDANREVTIVPTTPARVSVDGGRPSRTIEPTQALHVTGSQRPAYFVQSSHGSSHVEALASKLGWTPRGEGKPALDPRQEKRTVDVRSRACDVAREAAMAAGEPVSRLYDQMEGPDPADISHELLKEAMRRSEQIITTILDTEFPGHAITVEGRSVQDGVGSYDWIVDPIDGTGNFAHGNPNYTITLALVDGDEPIVGVVYSPETDELFHAIDGRGAYRNGRKIEPTDRDKLEESMLLSGYDPTGAFLRQFYRQVRGVRRLGCASLHLCFVAAGSADAHWEYDTYPWDVAAGLCILREAGGRATDATGNPYSLQRTDIDDRSPLLTSNGSLHDAVLAELSDEL